MHSLPHMLSHPNLLARHHVKVSGRKAVARRGVRGRLGPDLVLYGGQGRRTASEDRLQADLALKPGRALRSGSAPSPMRRAGAPTSYKAGRKSGRADRASSARSS